MEFLNMNIKPNKKINRKPAYDSHEIFSLINSKVKKLFYLCHFLFFLLDS